MYFIDVPPRSLVTLRRTRPLGIDSSEILLPRQQRVVDLERAAANLDRALDALRRQPGVDEPEPSVQRLHRIARGADVEAEPRVAAPRRLGLGRVQELRPDPATAVRREHLHV